MVVTCAECGGKVSSEASACPHCGAPVKLSVGKGRCHRNYDDHEDEETFIPPEKKFNFVDFLAGILKTVFLILAILVIFSAVMFFFIRYDLCGVRTGLRKIAESDSGTGSHVDTSNSRVMFKFYLGAVLDSLELKDGKTEEKNPQPEKAVTVQPVPKKDPDVFERVERKPIELPPPPPQE